MTDPHFYIETPRLFISYLLPEDDKHCDFLVELYTSPEFVATCGQTTITSREAARKLLAGRFRDEHARNGYGTFLVSLKSTTETPPSLATSTPVGTVQLMRGEEPNRYPAPDLGYAILPSHMRRGYTKEAAQALMDFTEKNWGVDEVLGLCDPKNEASAAVFRSLGFQDRGVHELRVFGGEVGSVWTKPGVAEDLVAYLSASEKEQSSK
ncbi:including n-acetylases of ribosomal protein [Podospora didyma]|uniref:Including n-acetylases of ribosomal protein n=1 Tax=Podospora didyma TaxID=330526 RepID=A0AAE0NUN3_9PEZI|nr:including n-acetylases of ribosomal protein [Podospora didyma]